MRSDCCRSMSDGALASALEYRSKSSTPHPDTRNLFWPVTSTLLGSRQRNARFMECAVSTAPASWILMARGHSLPGTQNSKTELDSVDADEAGLE